MKYTIIALVLIALVIAGLGWGWKQGLVWYIVGVVILMLIVFIVDHIVIKRRTKNDNK